MPSHVEDYTKNVLKVVVAQVCQIIGWNAIHQSSLEVLVDTLDRFMQELTKQTYRITELYQRTEPTLDDLALAFHYLNINVADIKEYIDYVGPPDTVPAVPKYPAPPPQILNVKRMADDVAAEQANANGSELIQPQAEDSEDEAFFASLFQYNREYKTEITERSTEGGAGDEGGADVKKEENGEGKSHSGHEDHRLGSDSKQDLLKKATLAGRIGARKKHLTVQLTPGGRIQGVREGRLPCADIPPIFQSEIDSATSLEQQSHHQLTEHKPSKSKGHKHHHESNGGSGSRSGTPSFPNSSAASASSSSKRHKLTQEPDMVKANIFKKISHQPRHSPVNTPPVTHEVIDVDSSPNPTPVYSPAPAIPAPVVKKEKKDKKKKEKERMLRDQAPPSLSASVSTPDSSSLLDIPKLPAGTTLEAIPMHQDPPQPPVNPFQQTSNPAFFPGVPNFSLPQGPGLIPFGNLSVDVPLQNPVLAALQHRMPGMFAQVSPNAPQAPPPPPADHSPRRKEKEPKKQKQQQSAPSLPPNLFLPDTIVRVETVVKPEPQPVAAPAPVVDSSNTINLLSDEDVEVKPSVAELDAKAAAKKAEKQKKKEQRRLEKLAAAAAAGEQPMNLSVDAAEAKKEKASKLERKLLKKMLKNKSGGGGGEGALDLSALDQEKQRKLEKKLKKLQKSNKAKLKAQAAEEAVNRGTGDEVGAGVGEGPLPKSPEPMLLPKLTLKLNSPKVGELMHSPKEHASKDYRPLTVDTGDPMTPAKRMKSGSAQNSPSMLAMPVEPELAKISPLVTRPMKQQQQHHHTEMSSASPSSSSGRGRPKGSSSKSVATPPPPVVPVKQEEAVSAAGGNQVWICPACGRVDDGSPMIGCDGCDNWYHWLCVGIHVAPESSEDWFCRVCIMQRKETSGDGFGFADLAARKREKKKKKKEKRMRMEESD